VEVALVHTEKKKSLPDSRMGWVDDCFRSSGKEASSGEFFGVASGGWRDPTEMAVNRKRN